MTYKQNTLDEQNRDSFFRTHYSEVERKSNAYKKPSILLFLLLLVFVSYDSFSADCIHFDRTVLRATGDYSIYYHENGSGEIESLESCSGQVVLTVYEYATLEQNSSSFEGLEELLVTLFAFDAEVFAIVELALIMAFLTSHYAGRVVRWLGK
jgi:hypothetical protein